jgi:hypothetical protein
MSQFNQTFETDERFEGKRYTARGWNGIAFRVAGWETSPISEWSCDCGACGFERPDGGGSVTQYHSEECQQIDVSYSEEPAFERTGRLLAVMIGDDKLHSVDECDLTEIGELDYCHVCGQIGCAHDGLDRSENLAEIDA